MPDSECNIHFIILLECTKWLGILKTKWMFPWTKIGAQSAEKTNGFAMDYAYKIRF